jgi:hypothetical protein
MVTSRRGAEDAPGATVEDASDVTVESRMMWNTWDMTKSGNRAFPEPLRYAVLKISVAKLGMSLFSGGDEPQSMPCRSKVVA